MVSKLRNEDTLIIEFDHSEGDIAELIVARPKSDGSIDVINQVQGTEAVDLYTSLIKD